MRLLATPSAAQSHLTPIAFLEVFFFRPYFFMATALFQFPCVGQTGLVDNSQSTSPQELRSEEVGFAVKEATQKMKTMRQLKCRLPPLPSGRNHSTHAPSLSKELSASTAKLVLPVPPTELPARFFNRLMPQCATDLRIWRALVCVFP